MLIYAVDEGSIKIEYKGSVHVTPGRLMQGRHVENVATRRLEAEPALFSAPTEEYFDVAAPGARPCDIAFKLA